MKIMYSWGARGKAKQLVEKDISEWTNAGFCVTPVDHRTELGIDRAWSREKLNELYINKDERLKRLYNIIIKLTSTHDVLIVNHENVYHPEFIKSLNNIYTVIVSGDDPESSDTCSKPYVHAFNHSFAWGVNFDKDTKVTEKFRQWGAKRADWWPHGVNNNMYNPSLTEDDIYHKERDIDLIFVGSHWLKLDRLVEIKKAFPQMRIYGRNWHWKGLLAHPQTYKHMYGRWERSKFSGSIKALFLRLWQVKELPPAELIQLYQRCKIGLNMHLSFGPCNTRLYQLPANGMMQICDCPEGLGEVFDIGKEVVLYKSTNEGINTIKHYLSHDEQRKRIATAGFRRTTMDYQRLTTFSQTMDKIRKAMIEEGIKHCKDGSAI